MGCGVSLGSKEENVQDLIPVVTHSSFYPRQTRIIQEEEVDVCIEDEFDGIDNDWTQYPYNYQVIDLFGEWRVGESAGGSRNDLELFSMNPQFLLTLGPPEKHPPRDLFLYPNYKKHEAVEVSVCLIQTGKHPLRHIAFFVYKTDQKDERLSAEYFLCVPPEGDTGAFVNWKQLRQDFHLTPGHYVIIPAIFKPHLNGEFKLSVFSIPPMSFRPI